MVDYLERNRALVREVNDFLVLRRGLVVGKSKGGTVTTAVGQYHSSILESELHLALKEYPKDALSLEYRILCDLAVIQAIAEKFPHLYDELPVVYALLIGNEGKLFGILTEDFSQGLKYKVEDIASAFVSRPKLVPNELRGIITHPEIEEFDLASCAFLVNGKRRLGDFNHLMGRLTPREILEKFPVELVRSTMPDYIVRINYDI